LSPTQIVVAAITSDADGYAQEVTDTLKAAGLRVECDLRNEKIGYKVREHSLAKVPLILVVGKKEAEERTVALRRLGVENERQIPMSLADAVTQLTAEATPPDLARLRR
jgi:threonyl-tRNA synthetase